MTTDPAMSPLSREAAQQGVHTLVSGEPPSRDVLDLITVGLDKDLKTFEREFFRPGTFLTSDVTVGSTCKIVQAYYGGGKSHYLRSVERTAHRHNFVSAFVGLKKDECPLTRFDLVYNAVAESLTAPGADATSRGFGALIRSWVQVQSQSGDDPFEVLRQRIDAIGDLPLMSMKVALRLAVMAELSEDQESLDGALVYLTSGKISPSLRKQGVLQPIDAKNGSQALRTLATLVRKLGYAGFVLILDEGDRSLSIASAQQRAQASNHLVQLVNETAADGAWPSTIVLYSIPSWESFVDAFGHNQALIQRFEPTGFPQVPPANRVVLDERQQSDAERKTFCLKLGDRLTTLFRLAYPEDNLDDDGAQQAASRVADRVLYYETGASFRRLFVQSFLSALYVVVDEGEISAADVEKIVTGKAEDLARKGN